MNNIMVVDDDPNIRELIRLILKKEGFEVLEASDGEDALEKIEDSKVDLIVLDIMMPKVDGWVVCHSVKSNNVTKDIKIIILTAKTQIRSKIKGLYILQADLYMTKPFDLDDLSLNISKLLHIEDNLAISAA